MNLLNENMFAPIVARTEQVLVGTQLEFRLFFWFAILHATYMHLLC